MKKQFSSNDFNRGQDVQSYGNSVSEPDIAGHEARQALYQKKRIKIAVISAVVSLLLIASVVFALYTTTDLFKIKDGGGDIDLVDGVTRLQTVDAGAFEAVTNGDYSSFSGIDVSDLTAFRPFLIGYTLEVVDNDVARIVNGKLYGLRPGETTVKVYSMEGNFVADFKIEVLDASGNLYYDVIFEGTDIVRRVISGRSLAQMGYALPAYPSRNGYTPLEWSIAGEKFFESAPITETTTVGVTWNPVPLQFAAVPLLVADYRDFFTYDLISYVTSGTGVYVIEAVSALPAGLSINSSGVIAGYPTEVLKGGTPLSVLSFSFDVRATDADNGTIAVQRINLKVNPRQIEASFNDYTNLIYNGSNRTVNAVIQNLAIEDIGKVGAVVTYNGGVAYVRNAGSYTARISSLTGDRAYCYELGTTPFTQNFSIAEREAEITFFTNNANDQDFDLVYNAQPRTIGASVANLINGDNCGVTLGYNLDDADRINVQNNIVASVLSLSNPNYKIKIDQPTKAFNIVKSQLTVTVTGSAKIYGDPDPAFILTVAGAKANINGVSEKAALETVLSGCFYRDAGENTGNYTLTVRPQYSADPILNNYEITVIDSLFIIQKRNISISVPVEITKSFDGTAAVYVDGSVMFESFDSENHSGKIAGDDLYFVGRYVDINNNDVVNASASFVKIEFTLGGAKAGNYELTGEYQGKINKFIVTDISSIIANDKVYDGNLTARVVYNDASLSGRQIPLDGITARFENENAANNVRVIITSVSLAEQYTRNYEIPASALLNAELYADITPRPVYLDESVSFVKTYDGTMTLINNTYVYRAPDANSGIIDGAALTFSGTYTEVSPSDSTLLNLAIDNNTNYVLAGSYYGVITVRDLYIVGTVTKEYDTTTSLNKDGLSFRALDEATGLIAADVDDVGFEGIYFDKNAGSGIGVWMFLTGAKSVNYRLASYVSTGTITRAPLTLTMRENYQKSYNGTVHTKNIVDLMHPVYDAPYNAPYNMPGTPTLTATGLKGSDIITSGTISAVDKNVGEDKALVLAGLAISGGVNNYDVTLAGTVTINQRSISLISIIVNDKIYDGTTEAIISSATFDGKIAGDDLTLTLDGNATVQRSAGLSVYAYAYQSQVVMTGTDSANYEVINIGDVFDVININKASVTPVGNMDKVYDGTMTFLGTLLPSGKIIGDDLYFNVSYASAIGGVSQLNLSLGGTEADNYEIAGAPYYGTIARREVTLVSDSGFVKTYDGTAALSGVTLQGLVDGETLSFSCAYDNASAGINKQMVCSLGMTLNYVLVGTYSGTIEKKDIAFDLAEIADAASVSLVKPYDGSGITINLTDLNGELVAGQFIAYGSYAVNKNAGTAKHFTVKDSLVILAGGTDVTANYNVTVTGAQAEITKRTLTISAQAVNKIYDGSLLLSCEVSGNSLISDDVVVHGSVMLDNKNVGTHNVTLTISVTGTDKDNYSYPETIDRTVTVSAKALTVTGNFDKVYDGLDILNVANLSLSGIIGSDLVALSTATYAAADAGTRSVTFSALTGDDASNYYLANTSSYSGVISPATVNAITVSADNKVYDGNRNASIDLDTLLMNGLIGLDTSSITYTGAQFATSDASESPIAVTLNGLALTNSNYRITAETSIDCFAYINKRLVTLSGDYAKTYDGTSNADKTEYSLDDDGINTGIILADIGFVGFEVAIKDGRKKVGNDYLIAAVLTGSKKDNYTLDVVTAKISVTARVITSVSGITFASKVFDGTDAADIAGADISAAMFGNIVIGEDPGLTLVSAAYDAVNAGVRTLTLDVSLTNTNYILQEGLVVTANGSITPAPLTFEAPAGITKLYNDTDEVTSSINVSGVITGYKPTVSYRYGGVSAGEHGIVITLSGLNSANYSVTGTLNGMITQRTVAVNIGDIERQYDGQSELIELSSYVSGLLSGHTLNGSRIIPKEIGEYNFSDSAWSNGVSVINTAMGQNVTSNYQFTFEGTYEITKKVLEISYNNTYNCVYNGTDTFEITDSLTIIGILPGDDVTHYAAFVLTSKNCGSYMNSSFEVVFDGEDLGNYDLTNVDDSFSADVNVIQRDVYVAIEYGVVYPITKVYDGTTAINPSDYYLIYAVEGDDVSVTGSYNNKNAGTNKFINLELAGDDADNYHLILNANIYGVILPAELTVTDTNAFTKTYDGNTSIDISGFELSSGTDDVTVESATFDSFNAGTRSVNVTLGGEDAMNYYIAPISGTIDYYVFTFDIGTAPVKTYDGYDIFIEISDVIPETGDLVQGFVTSIYANVGTYQMKNVMPFVFTKDGVGRTNNYITNVVFYEGTINPKSVTATVTASNKLYDGTTAASVAVSLSGVIPGDSVYAGYTSAAFTQADAANSIVVDVTGITLTGANAGNYTLANEDAATTADIGKVQIDMITGFSASGKTYDRTTDVVIDDSNLTFYVGNTTYSGITGLTYTASFSSANVGSREVIFTGCNLDNTNFVLASSYKLRQTVSGAVIATITAKTINVDLTESVFDKDYDGTDSVITENIKLTGVIPGDTVSVAASSCYITGASVTVSQSTLVIRLADNENGNYVLANQTLTGRINKKNLYIKDFALGYSKTYDASLNVTSAAGSLELIGVVAGDETDVILAGIYASKNVNTGIEIGFAISGSKSANYNLIDSATTGAITAYVITVTDIFSNEDNRVSKIYDGFSSYNGTFTAGTYYQIAPSVAGENVTIDIVSKTFNSLYTPTTDRMTAVFRLNAGNAVNSNYVLQAVSALSATTKANQISLVFYGAITEKETKATVTVSSDQNYTFGAVSGYPYDTAVIPYTEEFGLTLNYGSMPNGITASGNVDLIQLVESYSEGYNTVTINGTDWYYDPDSAIDAVLSAYSIGVADQVRFYILVENVANKIRYNTIPVDDPLRNAYESIKLTYTPCILVVSAPND